MALLQAGLLFIELDYLHHQLPTVAVPVYPGDPGSTPYRIIVIDPRPDGLSGDGHLFPVRVDEKLSTVDIPLNGDDVIAFDFDAPYQQTFESLFFTDEVDYTALPVEWSRYSESDQARILTRLLDMRDGTAVASPAPLTPLALDDALWRWSTGSV